jgi:hypothetical protein
MIEIRNECGTPHVFHNGVPLIEITELELRFSPFTSELRAVRLNRGRRRGEPKLVFEARGIKDDGLFRVELDDSFLGMLTSSTDASR